jgi:hypothetical protein
MTNFEDQLLSALMTEHGPQLRQLPQPGNGPAAGTSRGRRRLRTVRRPGWLATGAGGWITGPVPGCVSLPAAPGGQGDSPSVD